MKHYYAVLQHTDVAVIMEVKQYINQQKGSSVLSSRKDFKEKHNTMSYR